MLGFKLNHVSKTGPRVSRVCNYLTVSKFLCCSFFFGDMMIRYNSNKNQLWKFYPYLNPQCDGFVHAAWVRSISVVRIFIQKCKRLLYVRGRGHFHNFCFVYFQMPSFVDLNRISVLVLIIAWHRLANIPLSAHRWCSAVTAKSISRLRVNHVICVHVVR